MKTTKRRREIVKTGEELCMNGFPRIALRSVVDFLKTVPIPSDASVCENKRIRSYFLLIDPENNVYGLDERKFNGDLVQHIYYSDAGFVFRGNDWGTDQKHSAYRRFRNALIKELVPFLEKFTPTNK